MRRRDFVIGVGAVALMSPRAASAQPTSKVRRIGFLDYAGHEPGRVRLWDAFRQRMRELGYVEGDTVVFEPRWAEGKADRVTSLAAELVRLPVDIIVAASTPAVQAAKRATNTIPIVMTGTTDPVGQGLIASLNRPGANVTGLALFNSDLGAKGLELLREAVPQASRIAMIWDADTSSRFAVQSTQSAAEALGVSLQALAVRGDDEFDAAFASMVRDRAEAVIVLGSPLFFAARARLADLAAKHRIPALFNERSYVEVGGLMSYGSDFAERFPHAADSVDKILNGAKPSDLPVEQPTKFELMINLKTAKALGITVPQSLLIRADEVIE
jgi:putative tryptophan/tyrosine transport system substrate-binding protein